MLFTTVTVEVVSYSLATSLRCLIVLLEYIDVFSVLKFIVGFAIII